MPSRLTASAMTVSAIARNGVAGDCVAGVAQLRGRLFEIPLRLVVHAAGAEEVAGGTFEQRPGEEEIDRLRHARAAVVGDEETLDRRKARAATSTGRTAVRMTRWRFPPRWPLAKSACSPRLPMTTRSQRGSSSSSVSTSVPWRCVVMMSATPAAASCWRASSRMAFPLSRATRPCGFFEFRQFLGEMRLASMPMAPLKSTPGARSR